MGRLRVSISGFMGLIAVVAIILASLRESNDLWSNGMFTLAVGLYGVALLGALFGRRERRPTWAGFVVFGAGYLGICFAPGFDTHVMPRLLSTTLADVRYQGMSHTPTRLKEKVWLLRQANQLEDEVVEAEVFEIETHGLDLMDVAMAQGTTRVYPAKLRALSPDSFRQLCHTDLSLLLAFIGALIARVFAANREPASP